MSIGYGSSKCYVVLISCSRLYVSPFVCRPLYDLPVFVDTYVLYVRLVGQGLI